MITFEVCVDTPEGISVCEDGAVDRIELCSALSVGGLTPSTGLMRRAAESNIPAHAMVRPVVGGFELNDALTVAMLDDIRAARDFGLAGVVIGATTRAFKLDQLRLAEFVTAAGALEVTLHRAIDLCIDPLKAVDQAIELGINRILTSGGATTAIEGRAVIAAMVERAQGKIAIMAGSGVNAENASQLIKETNVNDVHASCSSTHKENPRVVEMAFGPLDQKQTDLEKIREIKGVLSSGGF